MHSLFLYLIFPYSVPIVQYTITMTMNKFFRSVSLEFFRIFSKPFSHSSLNFSSQMYNEFLQDVSWELQTTRSQTVPNSDCKEGMEQLKIQCYLSPLMWQHHWVVWRYHVEEASHFLSWQMQLICSFNLFRVFMLSELHFHTSDPARLVNNVSVVPKTVSMHFPAECWALNFFFWEKCDDNVQLTGFVIPGHSDAPNLCPLWQCSTEITALTFVVGE